MIVYIMATSIARSMQIQLTEECNTSVSRFSVHAGVLLSIVCPLLLAVWVGETQVSAADEVGCTSKYHC